MAEGSAAHALENRRLKLKSELEDIEKQARVSELLALLCCASAMRLRAANAPTPRARSTVPDLQHGDQLLER